MAIDGMKSEARNPDLFHPQSNSFDSVGNGVQPSAANRKIRARGHYLPGLIHVVGSAPVAAACQAVFRDELIEGNGALLGHESNGLFEASPFNTPETTATRYARGKKTYDRIHIAYELSTASSHGASHQRWRVG